MRPVTIISHQAVKGLVHEIARGLVTGLLIAMLVVTGQLVAQAKGNAPPDMAGSLCLSGSIVTFTIGEDGTPEGPAHICPDALVVAVAGSTPPVPAALWRLSLHAPHVVADAQRVSGPSPEDPPPARAPPSLV